jgi:surface polysaccharide O-acyltransferase-like enzyme
MNENIIPINRSYWIDHLRGIATLAVIVVHVSSLMMNNYNGADSNWVIANFFYSSERFCIPIFVMISGTLLLPKAEYFADFYRKRFKRIFLPFIFWSCLYFCYELVKMYLMGTLSTAVTAQLLFNRITEGTSFHLWYVYMIIGLYLFVPVIGKWARNSCPKEIAYFIFFWFFLLFIEPFCPRFISIFALNYFTGFAGYLVLGYYLSLYVEKSKLVTLVAILLVTFGFFVTLLGTFFASKSNNLYYGLLHSYLTPNIALLSVGVFLFIKNNFYRKNNIFYLISKHSFGIYLIHIFILIFLNKLGINGKLFSPAFGIPFTSLLCLLISFIAIFSINKVPLGKYISG